MVIGTTKNTPGMEKMKSRIGGRQRFELQPR
jgi:hypothetical protein